MRLKSSSPSVQLASPDQIEKLKEQFGHAVRKSGISRRQAQELVGPRWPQLKRALLANNERVVLEVLEHEQDTIVVPQVRVPRELEPEQLVTALEKSGWQDLSSYGLSECLQNGRLINGPELVDVIFFNVDSDNHGDITLAYDTRGLTPDPYAQVMVYLLDPGFVNRCTSNCRTYHDWEHWTGAYFMYDTNQEGLRTVYELDDKDAVGPPSWSGWYAGVELDRSFFAK